MSEVSNKAMSLFWRPLEQRGVSMAEVCEQAGVPLDLVADLKGRITWVQHDKLFQVLNQHFTEDEYTALGRSYLRSPGLRFAMVIARLAMSPMDFYRWFSKPREGVGNQMFSCIVPSHREVGPYEIELDLLLPPGYPLCWSFFLVSKGNMTEMPVLLGYPPAEVILSALPNGGRMRIKVPEGTAFLKRAGRVLATPFVRRDAAKELRSAHESLQDRYEELESAQMKLDRQAAQLRTAHSINVLVQRDVDVGATLETVARALVDEAGFVWAEVTLLGADAKAQYGARSQQPVIVRELEARGGEKVGVVNVTPAAGSSVVEHAELLEFIAPSLAIALQNALYRSGLEHLVVQRTAELTQARDELAGTVTELEDARGVRERFFGNISHEIRTPLSIVLLAVSDIEKRTQGLLDARAQAGLHSISDSARKLLRLVDELLLLAAGQEGKIKLAPEAVNLNGLITSLVAAWTPATEEAGLTLVVKLDALVTARLDPVALERVLTNLVSNAVKYTPRGGAIEIEMQQTTDLVRLAVLDNGPGISDELMGRLFGRFERAESEHRKIAGTGIGLSLVKQLVELHGGRVTALRRETGGTEMRIELPASLVVAQANVAEVQLRLVGHVKALATKQRTLAPPTQLAKGSILVAEDDPRLADMIAELLSDEYNVRVANDGASALEIAIAYQPELLITDVDMPVMDGIELSKRFREATNDKLAPIIILSAVLDLGTRVAGLDAGAVDYVTKPFDPAELKARVRAQFRMRELAVRLHKAEQLSTLGILTAGLAHELRNPANGVVNAIEPLRMLLPPELMLPGEGVGELVGVIGECAAVIQTLSKQLLGFKDSGSPLDLRPAKLRAIVERAAQLVKSALLGRRVEIEVPSDLTVNCAPPLLAQVFTNLLENSAHAAATGGWVKVTSTIAEGRVSIIVSDSGSGVPVRLRDKIFEPFFTTKPQGVGTGLGLPVSREIALRHGGNLELRASGTSSVFVLDLPVVPAVIGT